MVGAPFSYSGYQPSTTAAAGGGAHQAQASLHHMYATPNSPISILLPYDGSAPPYAAATNIVSSTPSSAPINTTYLYPPTYPPNPSLATLPPPFPPPISAPAIYPASYPSYTANPGQNLPLPALTGYPSQQPYAQNLYNQVPCGYPSSGQSTGTYPSAPSTTQYYPLNNSTTQPTIYPSYSANTGVYPPHRY